MWSAEQIISGLEMSRDQNPGDDSEDSFAAFIHSSIVYLSPCVRQANHATVGMQMTHTLDWWVKAAQIVQGFSAPLLAIVLGVITVLIQLRQSTTQRQQAKTQHLHFRLQLFERRMTVFDATMEFIALVLRDAQIKTYEPLFGLKAKTAESQWLFGSEIPEYIDELFKRGNRLRTICATRLPGNIMRPEDIPVDTEINAWFTEQVEKNLARNKFLKYMDFREP